MEDEKVNFFEDFITEDSIYLIEPKDVENKNQSLLDSQLAIKGIQSIVKSENIERNNNEECRNDCQLEDDPLSEKQNILGLENLLTQSENNSKTKPNQTNKPHNPTAISHNSQEKPVIPPDLLPKPKKPRFCKSPDIHVSINCIESSDSSEGSGNTHSQVDKEIKEEEHCLDDFLVKTEEDPLLEKQNTLELDNLLIQSKNNSKTKPNQTNGPQNSTVISHNSQEKTVAPPDVLPKPKKPRLCKSSDTQVSIDGIESSNSPEGSGDTHQVNNEIKEEHCLDDFLVKTEFGFNNENDDFLSSPSSSDSDDENNSTIKGKSITKRVQQSKVMEKAAPDNNICSVKGKKKTAVKKSDKENKATGTVADDDDDDYNDAKKTKKKLKSKVKNLEVRRSARCRKKIVPIVDDSSDGESYTSDKEDSAYTPEADEVKKNTKYNQGIKSGVNDSSDEENDISDNEDSSYTPEDDEVKGKTKYDPKIKSGVDGSSNEESDISDEDSLYNQGIKSGSRINSDEESANSYEDDKSENMKKELSNEEAEKDEEKDEDEPMFDTKIEVEYHGIEKNIEYDAMSANKSETDNKAVTKKNTKKKTPTKRRKRKKGSFKCNICEKVFTIMYSLKMHLKTVHLKIFKKCPHCEFKTPYNTTLKEHQKVVHEGVERKCTYCLKIFKKKSWLDYHVQKKHDAQNKKEQKMTVTSNFRKCVNCQKIFKDFTRYKTHTKRCFGIDKNYFFCHICPHKSARKANLLKHIRLHKNYKTYQCGFCEHEMLSQGLIDRHITLQHTKLIVKHSQLLSQPIYWCDSCDFRSIHKDNFDLHIRLKKKDNASRMKK